MKSPLLLLPLLMFLPYSAGAATYEASSTAPVNTYLAQEQVHIESPVSSDLITAGATVNIAAPVEGDILAAGGTVEVENGAGGDVRVAGGKIQINGIVGGDIAAAGGSLHIQAEARNIYAAGGSVDIMGSSTGSVTIYGANVTLGGNYAGNVSVVASNHLIILPGTYIQGTLKYSAPEQLSLPEGAIVAGGARYSGSYSYVPTSKQLHQYAVLGGAVFFIVRALAGAIVAGLVIGLFPLFSRRIGTEVLDGDVSRSTKRFLIGLLIAILVPVMSLLLFISLVGAYLGLVLIVLYSLLIFLSYSFTGIVTGMLIRQKLLYRINGVYESSWSDAVLGTLVVHLISLIPIIGMIAVLLLCLVCAGALLRYVYTEAFAPHSISYE